MCSCISFGVAFRGKGCAPQRISKNMKRLGKRNKAPRFPNFAMDSRVRRHLRADDPLTDNFSEEFAIYMNYVRKLGFEENPDYDFLRELFSKVLKTTGEQDDGVYDWMLLNSGKGWEAGHVMLHTFLQLGKIHSLRLDTIANPRSSSCEC
jgi:hypothetical protein